MLFLCRYDSEDPLDLGEALWLSHWALAGGEEWARVVAGRSAEALDELWEVGPGGVGGGPGGVGGDQELCAW